VLVCSTGFPHSDIPGSTVARHLPEAYRRHATSFIAFRSLGIHHTPFITLPEHLPAKSGLTWLGLLPHFGNNKPVPQPSQTRSWNDPYNVCSFQTTVICTRRRPAILRYCQPAPNANAQRATKNPPSRSGSRPQQHCRDYPLHHLCCCARLFIYTQHSKPQKNSQRRLKGRFCTYYPLSNPKESCEEIQPASAFSSMRSCCIVSLSRTVTVWSFNVSKSTVTQNGVPISSCRR